MSKVSASGGRDYDQFTTQTLGCLYFAFGCVRSNGGCKNVACSLYSGELLNNALI